MIAASGMSAAAYADWLTAWADREDRVEVEL
jgi:hypothetical protein